MNNRANSFREDPRLYAFYKAQQEWCENEAEKQEAYLEKHWIKRTFTCPTFPDLMKMEQYASEDKLVK